jgi:hypothetical protein
MVIRAFDFIVMASTVAHFPLSEMCYGLCANTQTGEPASAMAP